MRTLDQSDVPTGYRRLGPNEEIEPSDLYISSSGSLQRTPIAGCPPLNPAVTFLRRTHPAIPAACRA